MHTTEFSFYVSANRANSINIKLLLDGQEVQSLNPTMESVRVSHALVGDESEHVLEIVMSGKTIDDTSVDDQDNITADTRIKIQDIEFDGINIDQLFYDKAEYHHDFNGTQQPVVDLFYGEIGCNGRVTLEFTTPIYLWLLESM